jgi:RNA polymerase sigma-70 factor (ECF subfamily)
VTLGVNVRIDAKGDASADAGPTGDSFDARQFACRLDVNRLEAERDRSLELSRRLAHSRKHDVGGREAGLQRKLDFPDRIRIGCAAQPGQQAHNGQRRIRLQRVVQSVRVHAERGIDRVVAFPYDRRTVHVQGRALSSGNRREGNTVAHEFLGGAEEADHEDLWRILTPLPADLPVSPEAIEALIQQCLSGDQLAWDRIVRLHWRKVFNVAYKFVGRHDEAEDLTQDIFLKVFKSLGTFDRRANFQTWLISVSRNLCIDHYRSVRKERETIDRGVDPNQLTPESREAGPMATLEQRDRVTLLRQALAELPDTLRTAILMRDIQELSYQDIAEQLKLPEGTVKSRINRGRAELARQVRKLRGDERAPSESGPADSNPSRTGVY